MNIRPLACLGLLCALASAAHAQTAAPVSLRYKFTPGQVRRYKITTDITTHNTMPTIGTHTFPAMPPTIMHSEMFSNLIVQSVRPTDGAATLVTRYVSGVTTLNGKPAPQLSAYAKLAAKPVSMVLSPQGKVLSMDLSAYGLGKNHSSQTLSKLNPSGGYALPDGPIKVGDTWHSDVDTAGLLKSMPMAPDMNIAVLSTLTAIEPGPGPIADIREDIRSDLGSVLSSAVGGMKTTGTMIGTTLQRFDIARGDYLTQDATMDMNTTIIPPASRSPRTRMGTFTMRMHMTSHTERLPDGPAAAPAS